MTPTLTLHAAALLVRRHGSILFWRIALELLAAGVFSFCAVTGWERIEAHPSHGGAWAAGAGIMLVGGAAYACLRIIYRAGTLRAMHTRLRGASDQGVLIEGTQVFVDAFASTYWLVLLDCAWLGCVALELAIALQVGAQRAAVSAVVLASTVVCGLLVQAYGQFAYVLSLLDGCDVVDAWPRLRAVLPQARGRFLELALLLSTLSAVLSAVDIASAVAAQVASDWPLVLVFVPLISAFTACVIDVAALLFVAAITDRLPIGIATRISIVRP